jgi:hypothetical protein
MGATAVAILWEPENGKVAREWCIVATRRRESNSIEWQGKEGAMREAVGGGSRRRRTVHGENRARRTWGYW